MLRASFLQTVKLYIACIDVGIMDYSQLVEYYQRLESTTKKLEKAAILAELFRKVHKKELQHVVHLARGRVFADASEQKIGFSTKLMIKAIAHVYGSEAREVEQLWGRLGDLGKVAEHLAQKKRQQTLASEKLDISFVINTIKKLATLEGAGTVNRKIQLVSSLLSNSSPVEARFVVGTILETLRIGVAEGIVRDAIAQAFDADVDDVEKANDLLADYGIVAEQAAEGRLKAVELVPGKPFHVMLAVLVKDIKEGFERVGKPAEIEFKYDGFRCITGNTPIYVDLKGIFSVGDLKIGDKVLTHTGKFRRVVALNKRKLDKGEKLYRLCTFLGNEFRITEKHPLLVFRDNRTCWLPVEKLNKTDELVFPLPRFNIRSILKSKMELMDESGYKKSIPVNKFFFRFLGYWIGDGYTNEFHNTERVGLIFNQKDRKLCNYYKNNILKNFKLNNLSENIHNGAIYLYWRDKPLRIWLSRNFRREWKGKMLPRWFYGISETQFNEFLTGWIESDGHTDELGRINITTKERDLAMFGQLLALKFNKIIGVKKIIINDTTYYKLIIPKTERKSRIKGRYVLLKILRLEEIKRPDPRTSVYNIQVAEDESYCTTMVTLHNCEIHKRNNEFKIFTRRMEEVTKQFPEIIEFAKDNVRGDSYILDSEVVGYDIKTGKYLAFQSMSQRIKRKYNIQEMAKKFPVEVNVFDILYYNGEGLFDMPFKKRRVMLERAVKEKQKQIVIARHIVTGDEKETEKFYKEALKAGHEGIIFKALDAEYKPGRYVGYMAKLKPVLEALDLVIVGAEWGEGKRARWLSSYTVACRDKDGKLVEIGKVSTGMKEKSGEDWTTFEELTKELKPLIKEEKGKEVTVKPSLVVEIAFEEIQRSPTYSSGYALRFPKVLRVRFDRGVSDISTLSEVLKIFYTQRGRHKSK